MKGKINFDLYPFQEDALRQLRDHRFNIILKSRQMGISTLSAGFALHSMLFNDEYKILVIATKQLVANIIGDIDRRSGRSLFHLMHNCNSVTATQQMQKSNNITAHLELSFSVCVYTGPSSPHCHAFSAIVTEAIQSMRKGKF